MELDAGQSSLLHESLMDFIFKHLDTQSKSAALCVCKEWNQALCSEPGYWEEVDLSNGPLQISLTATDLVHVLHRSKGTVRVLNTSGTVDACQAQQEQRFQLGIKLQESLPYTRGLRALALAAMLPRLQRLVLDERASCVGGMTDDFAHALASSSRQLQALEVHFERYSLQSECFTDSGVIALAEACRSLKRVTLHNCMYVTDRSLYAVAAHCRELEELSLGGYSERISDYGLTILFEACSQLRSVQLCSKLHKVTDESTVVLSGHCPKLEAVKLTQSASDASLRHLATGCPHLRSVVLKLSRQVTAAGVVQLALQCPRLGTLVLPGGFQLPGAEVERLQAACTCAVQVQADEAERVTRLVLQRPQVAAACSGSLPAGGGPAMASVAPLQAV